MKILVPPQDQSLISAGVDQGGGRAGYCEYLLLLILVLELEDRRHCQHLHKKHWLQGASQTVFFGSLGAEQGWELRRKGEEVLVR